MRGFLLSGNVSRRLDVPFELRAFVWHWTDILGRILCMDTIIRNVKDIGNTDRQALEHVIGQHLSEHQQLVIQVVNVAIPPQASGESPPATGSLPDWCNIYQGLSDEAVSSLEETVLTRADLSRATD
jgi:hypothetical protein